MNKLLLTLLAAMAIAPNAFAQLGGTDSKPGDSCTAAEEGHIRRNASADRDISEITLICDGTAWQSATGGGGSTVWLNDGPGGPAEVYYNGGNVGIGTNDPDNPLTVTTGGTGGIVLRDSTATDGYITVTDGTSAANSFFPVVSGVPVGSTLFTGLYSNILVAEDTGTTPSMVFTSRQWGATPITTRPLFAWKNNTTTLMQMAANGYLGIGASDPQAKLHVDASNNVYNSIATSYPGGRFLKLGAGTSSGVIQYDAAGNFAFQAASDLSSAPGTTTLRIESNGNVKIGGTTATTKLDVAGTLKIADSAELCNATTHEGAIRYVAATDAFQMCRNSATGWEAIGTGGGGITALTGEVTASGSGSVTATIAANAITNAKMADDAIGIAELSATGTASASTYLRGDNTWATVAGDDLGNHTATQTLVMGANWLNGDAGAEGLSVSTTGQVRVDQAGPASTYDVWVQGGVATSTEARNLALLGTETTDILYLNYNGEYTGGTVIGGVITGNGSGLTTLNATNLASGTVAGARLPAFTGDVTKAAGGTALTIAAGAVDLTHMSATGTKSSSTFLRGDNTWATPSGGGGVTAVTTATCAFGGFNGQCTVTCPATYYRTGCNANGATQVYPSGAGCYCTVVNGSGTCYAICSK